MLPSKYRPVFFFVLSLAALYLTSLYSYLLFHSLTELFSIIVAGMIFVLTWNTRQYLENGYLEFIGVAFLFVGVIDLLHTLAYRGMNIFPFGGSDLPTQLWISARYLQSLSFLVAPIFLRRRLKTWLSLASFAIITGLLLLSIFYWRNFPASFIEGTGLTPFKRYSEYLIAIVLIGALALLRLEGNQFAPEVLRWLSYSILVSIAAELAFSDYATIYGPANLLGHLLKIIAFYLVYKAIIETGFIRPYDLLFRTLKQSEAAERSVAQFPNVNPNPVFRVSETGLVTYANRSATEVLALMIKDAAPVGNPVPPDLLAKVQAALRTGQPSELEIEVESRVLAISVAPFPENAYVNLYGRDITAIRRAERNAHFLAEASAAMVHTIDPDEVVRITIRALGEHLKANRGWLDEIDLPTGRIWIRNDYTQEATSAAGEYRLPDSSPELVELLEAGQTVIVSDVAADPRTARITAGYASLNVAAHISVPRLRAGRWLATLTISNRTPRLWRSDEVALIQAVADRLWLAVENAHLFQDLRRSEQLYKAMQERLKLATEAAQIGAWHWDLETDDLDWDDTLYAFLQLPAGTPITFPKFLEILYPQDRQPVDAAVRESLATMQDFEVEFRTLWPDGSLHWLFSKGRGVYDSTGKPLGMTGITMDITPRKQSEDQFRQDAARDAALASISKIVAEGSLDDQAVFTSVARHTAETLGDLCILSTVTPDGQYLRPMAVYHPNAEAFTAGRKILEASPQRIDEGFSAAVIQTGEPVLIQKLTEAEVLSVVKPEYWDWVRKYGLTTLIAVPLRAGGRVIGTLSISRGRDGEPYATPDLAFVQDVADRTALAITNTRLYREAQRELALRRQADIALKDYARQLARSNRELQDFASIASHDLQEPLRKILSFSERLTSRHSAALGEEAQDYLNRMVRAAERMQSMLHSLLQYSRVTTRAQALVPVDLNEVIQGVLTDLEVRLEETGGRVQVSELPTIDADPRQMQQLFQNLIGNALKFHKASEAPLVQVFVQPSEAAARQPLEELESQDHQPVVAENLSTPMESGSPKAQETRLENGRLVRIVVQDNGIGFNEAYLERIFQPFQRLHGQNEYPGSGMGLAICQKIVNRHHGELTALSRVGVGTSFVVTLPISQVEKDSSPPLTGIPKI